MDRLKLLMSLTPEERVGMICEGMNPGSASDIKKYRQGYRASLQEKEEKAKEMIGNVASVKNLGSGHEMDSIPTSGTEYEPTAAVQKREPDIRMLRQQLDEDMGSYVTTNNGGSGARMPQQPQQKRRLVESDGDDEFAVRKPKPQQSGGKSRAYNEGYQMAKECWGAFTTCLQGGSVKDSFNHRMNVFKAYKASLEADKKYQQAGDRQALIDFRQGILDAEEKMFAKIQ